MEVQIEEEQAGGVSVHAGALLFALDLSPTEHNTGPGGCYYPPEGCEIAALKPRCATRHATPHHATPRPSSLCYVRVRL